VPYDVLLLRPLNPVAWSYLFSYFILLSLFSFLLHR